MKALALLTCLVSSVALADAVDVSITNRVLKGKGWPTVHVAILEPIAGFKLELTREGGKAQQWKGGGKPGVTRHLELDQPDGIAKWAGQLSVNLPNGQTSSMPLEFETEVVGPLTLTIDKDKDVDLAGRKLRFSINQPIGKVHLKVLMDSGAAVVDDDITFNGEPAGTKLEVSWPKATGNVLRIDLRAYGQSGAFNGVELTPWRIDIPHEEVNFASGKWDVTATEAPKLEASLKLIQEAISKFSSLADIKLYVVGHTDSVGANASNRTLSFNRARSIGAWFRSRGVRIPVFVDGAGEDALLVQTPDETDEPRNRRAEYIISIEEPGAGRWQRL